MEETFHATAEDVQNFAELSGDDNDIHTDADAAEDSMFGERVVHGVYALSWVSSMLADFGEGTTVLLGFDDVSFDKPVYLDEEVTIKVLPEEDGLLVFEGVANGESKFSGYANVTFLEE